MDRFIAGMVLCALVNGLFMRDTLYLSDLSEITKTIDKCPEGKYQKLVIKAQTASYLHDTTTVFCSDGTVVKRNTGK